MFVNVYLATHENSDAAYSLDYSCADVFGIELWSKL